MSPLLTVAELVALRADETPVRVLDVRWTLAEPDGHDAYLAGHVPGAVWVDLENELSGQGPAGAGRHPLPDTATLQAAAQRWGIRPGDRVVVYDDARSMPAARAWWLLTHAGLADVRVLDGGLAAWRDAGLALEAGEVAPEPGSVRLQPIAVGTREDAAAGGGTGTDTGTDTATVIDTDGAAAWPEHGVLLDVRAPERFRGEHEPIDPAAGHIPGARNLPIAAMLDGDRFADPVSIRDAFAAVGAHAGAPVAAYCGSGVTAAQAALAGAVAGIPVTVYPGSWSQWSNTPGLPVATGE